MKGVRNGETPKARVSDDVKAGGTVNEDSCQEELSFYFSSLDIFFVFVCFLE